MADDNFAPHPGRHEIVPLHVIPDARGKLCVVERGTGLPFAVRRVYYLFDIPTGSSRGGHAHLALEQIIIPMSGSFRVDVSTSAGEASYLLDQPSRGLYIGPYVWRELRDFSSNAVCLVLASQEYDEDDYIRDRLVFEREVGIAK